MNSSLDYDSRSLQHERRMLDVYRKGIATDDSLLQPLANACWRAAAFEWQTHQDADAVRQLWEEAARALTHGFTKRPAGFEQTPEQLLLALLFSIGAQSTDLAKRLVHVTPTVLPGSRQQRAARTNLVLAKACQSVLLALIEHRPEHARNAQQSLAKAHDLPGPPVNGEIDWPGEEQRVINALLAVVAGLLEKTLTQRDLLGVERDTITGTFSSLMDGALFTLEQFVEAELDHRPKLYCWLPGIALTVLATSAGLPMGWLSERSAHPGYSRLPLSLVLRGASAGH